MLPAGDDVTGSGTADAAEASKEQQQQKLSGAVPPPPPLRPNAAAEATAYEPHLPTLGSGLA